MTIRTACSFLGGALISVIALTTNPVGAQPCPNEPSRTVFVGGPGIDACSEFSQDEQSCNTAFHRSGAGHLAPCAWNGSTCDGNTAQWNATVSNSCETLPDPQTCIDPTRTVQLTGGTAPATGPDVCSSIQDQESCEESWHTTVKGVGVSCCWQTSGGCAGSIWGFYNGSCTEANTCFVSTAGRSAAPTLGFWGLLLVGIGLLLMGTSNLRARALA